MKILLLWLLLISIWSFSKAQTYHSSCIPSGTMESTYRNDACRLAIKRMYEINSPFADSVSISGIFIDSIAKALYQVANIQNALVGDTLRQIFGSENFAPGSDSTHILSASDNLEDAFGLKQIRVIVDNNTNWGVQWLSGNYNATSNDSVNYLINSHRLQVLLDQYQLYPNKTIYVISSPIAINATALARQFEGFSGVGGGNAYPLASLPGANGNFIRAGFNGDTIKLSYFFGCGDCPAGCTIGRLWNFKIQSDNDCLVNYTGVENLGAPLEWLTNACLDYMVTTETCPSGKTTFNTNLNGSSIYQWQVSTDGITFNNINDNDNYTGTATPTLILNNISSSWYANKYTCLADGIRGKVSFSVKFVNTWKSDTASDWENASNWSCGALPDSNTNVEIKTGDVYLNSDATVRSLTISAGATLNIATGVHLTILN